jgi:hypothetical protein
VQRLKHALTDRAPKTVNNVLSVPNVVLRKAVEWNVLEQMLCTIRAASHSEVSLCERALSLGALRER